MPAGTAAAQNETPNMALPNKEDIGKNPNKGKGKYHLKCYLLGLNMSISCMYKSRLRKRYIWL